MCHKIAMDNVIAPPTIESVGGGCKHNQMALIILRGVL